MRPTVLAVAKLLTQNWLVSKIHHPHNLGVVNISLAHPVCIIWKLAAL